MGLEGMMLSTLDHIFFPAPFIPPVLNINDILVRWKRRKKRSSRGLCIKHVRLSIVGRSWKG